MYKGPRKGKVNVEAPHVSTLFLLQVYLGSHGKPTTLQANNIHYKTPLGALTNSTQRTTTTGRILLLNT